jgi:hypothetical protein
MTTDITVRRIRENTKVERNFFSMYQSIFFMFVGSLARLHVRAGK